MPPPHPSTLEKTDMLRYEERIDSLGDLAALFICSVFGRRNPIPCPAPRFQKYILDSFITDVLRHMKLEDDVLFGVLMFIQRISFRARELIFKKYHGHQVFIAAYIISAKELARETGDTSRSLENYTEWCEATQRLFSEGRIQRIERTVLRVLQEDRKKGLQADTTFDGLLPNFRDMVIEDYEVKWKFTPYPQSFATVRPVFMIYEPDEEA